MKIPLTLVLGILIGTIFGFLAAKQSSNEASPRSPISKSSRKPPSNNSHIPTQTTPKAPSPATEFSLSNWRDTYHLVHLANLVEEISRLTDDDFPEALDRAKDDHRINVILYQHWAKLNPHRALTHLLEETDYNSLDCLEDDLPDVALLTGTALIDKEGKNALPLIHALMKRVDEGGIGYNYGDFSGYQSLFTSWAATDFDSALQFLMIEKEGYWYDGSEIGLAEGAAQAGRSQDLMKWISDHPDTFLAFDLVKRTISAWAENDPKAALLWAQSDLAPPDESALEGVTETWIQKNTDAFLDWARSQGPPGIRIASEHARHDPQKITAWLFKNDDGSPAWNKVRNALLEPLDHHKGPVPNDLERYFQLITSGDQENHRKRDHLGKLFLKYTQNPGNYSPGDERPFRLHETGPVSDLVQKYGLQIEFDQFREHQRKITIESNRLKKEMNALSDSRQKLYHESGLEQKR